MISNQITHILALSHAAVGRSSAAHHWSLGAKGWGLPPLGGGFPCPLLLTKWSTEEHTQVQVTGQDLCSQTVLLLFTVAMCELITLKSIPLYHIWHELLLHHGPTAHAHHNTLYCTGLVLHGHLYEHTTHIHMCSEQDTGLGHCDWSLLTDLCC